MKFLKFLAITLITISITCVIPLFLFNTTRNTSKFIQPVEGSVMPGAVGYLTKITTNPDVPQDAKNDVSNLYTLFNDLLEYKNSTYNNLVSYLVITENILIISFGIMLLKKTNYKTIGNSFITSGIISILVLLFLIFTIKMNIII